MKRNDIDHADTGTTKSAMNERRNFLKIGTAALAAASVPAIAAGAPDESQKVFYAHGMAWNPDLPGALAGLRLTFDFAARVGGTGVGTFADAVQPDFNARFKIDSVERNGNLYRMSGEITAARDQSMVGMPLTIDAEVEGSATSVLITVGTLSFKGAGLVVIAIIAILIALLIPATTL
jgi:hypothetical protein